MKNPSKAAGLNSNPAIDVDDFITLLYAAGNRLLSLRRKVAHSIGLNSPEFAAMLALQRLDKGDGVRIKALADEVHIAATNMTTTVNALHASGWVTKLTDKEDSRAVRISLTDEAHFRLGLLAERIKEINRHWFGVETTEEQLQQSCQVLSALTRNYEHALALTNALDFREDLQGRTGITD